MNLLPKTIAILVFAVAMPVMAQKDSPSGGTNDVTQTDGGLGHLSFAASRTKLGFQN